MNKPLSLLFLATLSCGAISLAAYVHKDENKKDINQTVKAEGDNILTLDYTNGTYTKTNDTFNVGGGTITMQGVANKADKAPSYNSTNDCVYYYYHTSSGEGSGTVFTLSGVSITKVVLTVHGTYTNDVKYKVNDGDAIEGTWSSSLMTISGINATSKFEFYNAETNAYQVRIDKIEIEYANTADFNAVNNFVTANMHKEVSFDDKGTGLCISGDWYVDAKKELVKLTDSQIDIFKNNSYFAKYHERYLSWADANHDTSPYAGDGIILSNTTTIDKKNDNIAPLIVSISSFSLSFVILCSMVYSYKKEN